MSKQSISLGTAPTGAGGDDSRSAAAVPVVGTMSATQYNSVSATSARFQTYMLSVVGCGEFAIGRWK
jgi:hypothetical protein